MVWEVVFMLVILKIPVVYLCLVVWWAIRAEPRPLEGAALPVAPPESPPGRGWRRTPGRPRRPRPHGGPARSYPRTARAPLVGTGRR